MTVNTTSKEILARLLSQENIDVTHDTVATASFDVLNRVLTLPMWDKMESFTYDHLVGHEVGHALYTPSEGWMDKVEERGQAFKGFLNVVEDARIEKLIQRRFPGLRRSFVRSYQNMLADNFFGASVDEINSSYDLIDRLNVLFKCGESVGIRIEEDEKVWVEEMRGLETFEEALDCAIRLFEAMSSSSPQPESSESSDQEIELPASQSEDGDTSEKTSKETEAANDDASGKEDEVGSDDQESESQSQTTTDTGGETSEEPVSLTDKVLSDSIREISSTNEKVTTVVVDPQNWDNIKVTTPDQIAKDLAAASVPAAYKDALFNKFKTNNKKTINYLVKEFEMKKRAAEYARTTTSKSGVIDTVKMNNYKFSDDIFSRVGVVANGKSHGMILYLDWSGSMCSSFSKTVEQCLCLASFCKQVAIPFKVLAFTDVSATSNVMPRRQKNHMSVAEHFRFIELLNSDLTRSKFTEACKNLLCLAVLNSKDRPSYEQLGVSWDVYSKAWSSFSELAQYRLNSTPLNDAIIAGIKIHNKFKAANRLDIVNAIFLTDGCSNPLIYDDGEYQYSRIWSNCKTQIKFRNQRYIVDNREDPTKALLEIYGDETGSNVVGIRIVTKYDIRGHGLYHILSDRTQMNLREVSAAQKTIRKDKWMSYESRGFDKSFLILDTSMKASNAEFDVDEDASKNKIKTAFSKSMSNRLTSRKMLTEFIDMVA